MPYRHLSLVPAGLQFKPSATPPFVVLKLQIQIFPSPDESVSLLVGEVQSYPLGRWTQNYLPVDPLPAETGAPLD